MVNIPKKIDNNERIKNGTMYPIKGEAKVRSLKYVFKITINYFTKVNKNITK